MRHYGGKNLENESDVASFSFYNMDLI